MSGGAGSGILLFQDNDKAVIDSTRCSTNTQSLPTCNTTPTTDDDDTTTTVTTSVPSSAIPSSTPSITIQTSCIDSTLRFKLKWQNKRITRDCIWVGGNKLTTSKRCAVDGVAAHSCPLACGTCSSCVDSTVRFKLTWQEKKIHRECEWVKNRATYNRCKVDGVSASCRATCGQCERGLLIFVSYFIYLCVFWLLY